MKQARVLIVDREPGADDLYARALAGAGPVELIFLGDAPAALAALGERPFDLLIATIAPPSVDGLDLLAQARAIDSRLPVILVDREPTLEKATHGLRLGAGDYLAADAIASDLAASARRLLGERRIEAEYDLLRRQVERPTASTISSAAARRCARCSS